MPVGSHLPAGEGLGPGGGGGGQSTSPESHSCGTSGGQHQVQTEPSDSHAVNVSNGSQGQGWTFVVWALFYSLTDTRMLVDPYGTRTISSSASLDESGE